MKYLLTGATGFIGSHLLRRLVERGEKPFIILRKDSDTWRIKDIMQKLSYGIADLEDTKAIESIVNIVKPDIVYHLATYYKAFESEKNPDQVMRTNLFGGWNLLRASKDCELFVNTGSLSEYGAKAGAMKETDVLNPANVYGVTKCAMTWACMQFKNTVTLRPFCVYGPGEPSTRLIPRLMMAFLKGDPVRLVSPEIPHDFVYVDDIVDAYLNIKSLKKVNGVYNLGTGRLVTIKELVYTMDTITGKHADLSWDLPTRSWDTTFPADTTKTKEHLGWTAKISIEEGLRKTWNWQNSN